MADGDQQGQVSIKPLVDEIEKLEGHFRRPELAESEEVGRLLDVLSGVKTILKAQCRKGKGYVYIPLDNRDNANTPRK